MCVHSYLGWGGCREGGSQLSACRLPKLKHRKDCSLLYDADSLQIAGGPVCIQALVQSRGLGAEAWNLLLAMLPLPSSFGTFTPENPNYGFPEQETDIQPGPRIRGNTRVRMPLASPAGAGSPGDTLSPRGFRTGWLWAGWQLSFPLPVGWKKGTGLLVAR